jgi:hypothetical protein
MSGHRAKGHVDALVFFPGSARDQNCLAARAEPISL